MAIAFLRVEVIANVGPLAQCGLDEAFSLAIGARSVRTGKAVLDAELEAGGAKRTGAIAGAVVGEQAANGDSVLGVEGDGGTQEGDGGFALLVGQHEGEGEAGVIVDGNVQSLPASELRAAVPHPSRAFCERVGILIFIPNARVPHASRFLRDVGILTFLQ